METKRISLILLTSMSILGACAQDGAEDSPDGQFQSAFQGGKADNAYNDCQQQDILDYVNGDVDFSGLVDDGVHVLAALNIANTRSGPDGVLGSDDDFYFDSIEAIDAVDYVGPSAMRQLAEAAPKVCGTPVPIAHEVNVHWIDLDDVPYIEFYTYPYADGFAMGGTEFWQRWPGGASPTYEFEDGTDLARQCMQASAIRFNAIMENPPEELIELREQSNWEGRFFNWNDDFTLSEEKEPTGARLWAWRTGLVKWISQTDMHGGCYLPTWDLVQEFATDCLVEAKQYGGEIEGCSASIEISVTPE